MSPDLFVKKANLMPTDADMLSDGAVADRGELIVRLNALIVTFPLNSLSMEGFTSSCSLTGRPMSVTSPVVASTDANSLAVRVASCPDDLSIGSRQYPDVIKESHGIRNDTLLWKNEIKKCVNKENCKWAIFNNTGVGGIVELFDFLTLSG